MYWLDKLQLEQEEYARRRSEELKAAQARNAAESAEALKDFVSIPDIKKRIGAARAENNAMMQNALKDKQQYEKAREDAAADMETYSKKGDADKYLKAKRAYEDATEAINLLSSHIRTMETCHMVEYDEYIAVLSTVKAEFDPEIAKAHAEMIELLSKCREIAARLKAQTRGVNEVIDEWQRYIYRDDRRMHVRYDDEERLVYNLDERFAQIMRKL